MISPTGEEEVYFGKETNHRWNASEGKKGEAQPQGNQGVFLIQPCEIGDAITAGTQGEQNDAGEGA